MNKSTNTYWQWTEAAERKWQHHATEPRRAGQMLTHLEGAYRVPTKKVPLLWVEKGYVREAEAEQISLF